jgi:DNA polymerase-3 subunit delta'
VLGPLAEDPSTASHAYLLHGPPGTGKRAAARSLAVSLLGDGARSPGTVAERVARDAHPDLTWVSPSGASEMLVADIEEPVVSAAARTPFESARRVFVIESVEAMNDQSANRMLKTLEEPLSFVHLVLLSDRLDDVLPTIASRCQLVRFDPLGADRIAASLEDVEEQRARACARLALGDARLAGWLAGQEGEKLRQGAEAFVRGAISGESTPRAWLALIERAGAAGAQASEAAAEAAQQDLELLPQRERKRHERELLDSRKRTERRARTRMLDLSLRLAELWLRDLMCVCEGAPELVYGVDRRDALETEARGCDARGLREAVELVAQTRLSLALNVNEELALEALGYRLAATLGS